MRNFFYLFLTVLFLWHFSSQSDYLSMYHLVRSAALEPAPTARVLAPDDPLQTMLVPGQMAPWTLNGCTFKALAQYSITARILHTAEYTYDGSSQISPLDFALGWGRMSDPTVYGELNIGQSGRWYSYSWSSSPPMPDDEIISHSANTHLIPATDVIRDQLFGFETGDVINLTGYLVQVDGPNNWTWTSSLSRTDTGAHACEVMWVSTAAKVGR